MAHQAGAYPGFCSMKRLGVFVLPPGWDASPSQGYPPCIKFAGTHLYTWVERGTMRPPRLPLCLPPKIVIFIFIYLCLHPEKSQWRKWLITYTVFPREGRARVAPARLRCQDTFFFSFHVLPRKNPCNEDF